MSGEAVVPIIAIAAAPVIIAGAGIALTVTIAGATAKAVKRRVEERQAAARKRLEEEKAQIAAWQAQYQHWLAEVEEQRRQNDSLRDLQHQLLANGLRQPGTQQTGTKSKQETIAGRSELHRQQIESEQTKTILENIGAFLTQLPASVVSAPRFKTFRNDLDQQLRSLATPNSAVSLASAMTLHAAVQRTAADHLEQGARTRAERKNLLQQAHELIQSAFALESLDPNYAPRIRTLREELIRAATERTLTTKGIELSQRQLAALRAQIERSVALGALRPALAESLCGHLRKKGYQVLTDFPSTLGDDKGDALVRIPGGERVHITMDTDGRLKFGVQHERQEGGNTPLSHQEKLFLRQQERRWCADLKEVIRALVADGFPCQIEVERPALFELIPIVNFVPFRAEDKTQHQAPPPTPSPYDWQVDWERQGEETAPQKRFTP